MKLLGVILIIAGLVVGAYLDIFVLFIGGIMQLIDGIKANPTNSHDVTWGILRAFVFGSAGSVATFLLLIAPGFALLTTGAFRKMR